MKFIDLQNKLQELKIFNIRDLEIIDANFNKSKISSWNKKWYIKNLRKWYYIFWNLNITQSLLYFIANKLYINSYISLEFALNYYWIIPEQSFVITSVSNKKTINFETFIWNFSYKKIKSGLFWWYNIININNNKILIWDLEKVILDYFYLNKVDNIEDLKWLRWNKDILLEKIDFKKIKKYSKKYNSKIINDRVNNLFHYLWK